DCQATEVERVGLSPLLASKLHQASRAEKGDPKEQGACVTLPHPCLKLGWTANSQKSQGFVTFTRQPRNFPLRSGFRFTWAVYLSVRWCFCFFSGAVCERMPARPFFSKNLIAWTARSPERATSLSI